MLLSHNFDVSSDLIPPLSQDEFVTVFRTGLNPSSSCQCRQVNHPHWVVEILFSPTQISPQQVGQLCATAMRNQRQTQGIQEKDLPNILILGGMKTTPPTSNSPDALQPGEWGVDVVETPSGKAFLAGLNWDEMIASKPVDSIFKVELL